METTISIKTFYFVNHQLYLSGAAWTDPGQPQSGSLLYFTRHEETVGPVLVLGLVLEWCGVQLSLAGSWSCDRKRGACHSAVTSCPKLLAAAALG